MAVSNEIYLRAEGITKRFGDVELFDTISLSVHKNEKIALIARNGAGKSTFLQIIAGKIDYDHGIITQKNDIKIAYLEQSPHYNGNLTVEEAIYSDFKDIQELLNRYEQLLIADPKNELAEITNRIEVRQAWNLEVDINRFLTKLKLTDKSKRIGTLSGGQVKRLALASVLLQKPDLLILDEPTNHLDLEMIEWLEDYLMESSVTLLMVTHDRYFLDRVCSRIVELEDKKLYSYSGNYSYYLQKRSERIEQHNAEVSKAKQLLKKELEWLNRMPKARTTKAKYRIENVDIIKEKASQRLIRDRIKLNFPSRRLGQKVVNLYNVSKQFDDLQVIKDLSYKFTRTDRIGIVGKNGSGKSTLLNLIAERLKPTSGHIDIGTTVSVGYYRQDGLSFREDKRVIDIVTDIMEVVNWGDGKKLTARAFLNYFLFPPKMQQVKVENLSGGEKRRLYLMTILMQNPNFLILDEPTNDLDIITLNVLEEYLLQFEGALVIVSHDRYFTDKLVDHLFVFEDNKTIRDFPGNYTQYRSSILQKKSIAKNKVKASGNDLIATKKNDYSKRLSYNEKMEFERLEHEIDELTIRKKELETLINTETTDHNALMKYSKEYNDISELLEKKEWRWLELSEKA